MKVKFLMPSLLVCLTLATTILEAQSPRLFLTQGRIDTLKQAICEEESHHHELFQLIKNRVDDRNLDLYGGDKNNYRRSYQAVENALIYILTDDTVYARQAYDLLIEMYTSGDEGTPTIPDTGNYATKTPGSKALTYAFPSMAYGICYDWARSGWYQWQADTVMAKMQQGLDEWEALFRWELYDMPSSNWVSVCRSAELIMMLGAQQETVRQERYDTLKYLLRFHYDLAYGPSGYSNEGLGYIHYGVPFAYAANYAALSIGDSGLVDCFEGKSFDKLMMYTFAYTEDKKHLMTSVDSHYPFGEGVFGLIMGNLDTVSLKYYKNFYDHHLGTKSSLENDDKYDQRRLGAVWNLLYYPIDLKDVNPTAPLSYCLADHEFGAYFIRSRWKNKNDILFNVMGKYSYHRKGWQDAETFNIGLVAFGDRFFGGPGKGGNDPNYSSLLIDAKAKESSKHTGNYHFFEEKGDEIYVVVDGGPKYSNMGVTNVKRHVLVKFLNDSTAIIAAMDKIKTASKHSYRWQLNIGHEEGDAGITADISDDNGRSSFLLTGTRGGFVKGWYLSDNNLDFQGNDPLFTQTLNKTEDNLWVVMYVGMGDSPVAQFADNGIGTIMEIENQYIYYDSDSDRILISELFPVSYNPQELEQQMRVYPVPADNEIIMELPKSNSAITEIKIVNLIGQVVFSDKTNRHEQKINLNINQLPEGMYRLITRSHNGNAESSPFVIMHP